MEGVKMWLNSQAADFFDRGVRKLIASVLAVTMLRNNLSMHVFFAANKIFFSLLVLLTAHWRLLSEQPSYLVQVIINGGCILVNSFIHLYIPPK
jgi:hypothetical protein